MLLSWVIRRMRHGVGGVEEHAARVGIWRLNGGYVMISKGIFLLAVCTTLLGGLCACADEDGGGTPATGAGDASNSTGGVAGTGGGAAGIGGSAAGIGGGAAGAGQSGAGDPGGAGAMAGVSGLGGAGGDATGCNPTYPLPEITVGSYGAVGDGVTDDTAALKDAFEEVEANGGTIVFEIGKTYRVSERLLLQDATNFGIRGNGATIQVAPGTPTDNHCPLTFSNCSSFVVGDIVIDGNRQNRTPKETIGGHNIRLRAIRDFVFCRVTSNNATTDGFYLFSGENEDPDTFPQDGVFQDCHADFNFRQGMSIINGRRLQIIDSSFTNTSGTSPQAGVDIEPNAGSAEPGAEHILFRGCLFEGNKGYGLNTGGKATTNRLTVEDNTFRANAGGALIVEAGWVMVRGNVVEEHTAWNGLLLRGLERAHDIVIRENTFRNNTGRPEHGDRWIYVSEDSGTNNFLLENIFENNEDTNIYNQNPEGTCAAGNLMDGQLDAPLSSCGQPPTDIGFGSGS